MPSKETRAREEKVDDYFNPQAKVYPVVMEEYDTDTKWYLENDCQAYANIQASLIIVVGP